MTLAAIPFLWSRRHVTGLIYLLWMHVAVAVWIAGAGMEMAAATEDLKFFWSQVCYLGTMTLPVFLLLFALEYVQPENHWGWGRVLLLVVMPVLTWVVVFTDALRPLNWPSLRIDPSTNIGIYGHGPWFWLASAYIYGVILVGLGVLFSRMLRRRAYFRSQITLFALAAAFPLVGNILYLTGLNPVAGMEWTPISLGFMSITLAWGALRQKALVLVPVARERLLDCMTEGVVVLDVQGQIVDANAASERFLGRGAATLVGQALGDVIGTTEAARALLGSEEEQRVELILEDRGAPRYFDAQMSPLRGRRGQLTGRLVVFRDITRYKRLEQEREDLIHGLQEALAQVKVLQGLLPICASCKRIRDDQGYWHSVESYISEHSDASFTHGLCPDCARELYPELFKDESGC
ncbi:MAG: PAS domain-containing protein [Chloroflexi bacterium]|nr:PAS domain-containing protein [Chloroflexota bacterium]